MVEAGLIHAIDAVAREMMLFAAVGFAIGGLDDLAVDLVYAVQRLRGGRPALTLADLPAAPSGRIPVFVAAWDESRVIGTMLRTALSRFDHDDYRIYVGAYPNDPATIRAVADVAFDDDRVRLVIGPRDGPTTKADNLNVLWRALLRDEAAEGVTVKAVALHDAEDMVHPAELRIFDMFTGRHAAVQLPVLPLVHPRSRFVSGHYADEFAEAHGKQLVVRQALGAALPLAGTGCALERGMLGRLAARRGGGPFDAASLTEDYELGIGIGAQGGRGVLVRMREHAGGPLVAVRAYFPMTVQDAVRQKTRWMIGIALAGWDRTGWSRGGDIADHWMRMRDRRGPAALLVLAAAYAALLAWAASQAAHRLSGDASPVATALTGAVLALNAALLGWRSLVRAGFVWRAYGPVEAIWSVPRMLVGNTIALLAARRALWRYAAMLRGREFGWDKTAHEFPDAAPATPAG